MRFPLTYFHHAPDFTVWQSHTGIQSRVLITAGIDGDEYDGINAAQYFIKNYVGDVPITIIPIVNLAGYHQKVSYNPLDHRYPKSIYPGSIWGSSSSRLMNLVASYARNVELWLDLHGGASNEHLNPFVWAQQTRNKIVDNRTTRLLSLLNTTTLYTNSATLPPALPLAKHSTSYIMLESGELGRSTSENTVRHLSWVNTIIKNLDKTSNISFTPTYQNLKYQMRTSTLPNKYFWYSENLVVSGY